MITQEILLNNLNDKIAYPQFFQALGYNEDETIYLRTFNDKDKTANGHNKSVQLCRFDNIIPTLRGENATNRGIFFVVNGDGPKDENVKHARAQFIDFDDFPFDEQIKRLAAFPLEPSIIVKTQKSLHAYWLLKDGDIRLFREVQQRLIQYFGSDGTIKNESRVMRLYGFNHCKTNNPVLVTLIKFDPDIKYTQWQFHEVLPLLKKTPGAQGQRIRQGAERPQDAQIKIGYRFKYLISRIGEFLAKLKDSVDDETILAMLWQDFQTNCEAAEEEDPEEFRTKYLKAIAALRVRHEAEDADPGFWSYAMKAWKEENPGKDFAGDWQAVREAGERAQDADKEFDSKYTEMKQARATQTPAEGAQRDTEGPAEDPAGNTAEKQETPPKDDLTAFLEKIQTEAYKPYKTELPFFDDLLGGGLTRQTVTLLMAAPGAGKTSLAAQVAEAMAEHGKGVVYLNLEMSREQMLAKAISGRLARKRGIKVTALQILQGYNWTEEQRQAIPAEIEQYRQQIFPCLQYNPADIGSDLERIRDYLTSIGEAAKAAGRPAPAVFLDYLHLVTAPQYDTATLIKATVTMLKEYALHYDTVVLGIVAANRDSTKSGRLTLESGRDSSNLEFTADCQLSLNYYDIDNGNIKPSNINGIAWLQREPWRLMIIRVLKGRFVTPGKSAKVYFNAAYNSFYGEREYMPADPTRRPFNRKPELPEEWQSVDTGDTEGAAAGSGQGQQITRL